MIFGARVPEGVNRPRRRRRMEWSNFIVMHLFMGKHKNVHTRDQQVELNLTGRSSQRSMFDARCTRTHKTIYIYCRETHDECMCVCFWLLPLDSAQPRVWSKENMSNSHAYIVFGAQPWMHLWWTQCTRWLVGHHIRVKVNAMRWNSLGSCFSIASVSD